MNIWNLIDQPFASHLTTTLLHFLWQGTALALIAVTINGVLLRGSAHARYTIHVGTLIFMLACVPVTYTLVCINDPAQEGTRLVATNDSLAEQESESSSTLPIKATTRAPLFEGATPGDQPRGESLNGAESELPATMSNLDASQPVLASGGSRLALDSTRGNDSMLTQFAPWVALLYYTGVVCLLLRLLRGTWGSLRLRRSARELADRNLVVRIREQAKRLGMQSVPMPRWSERISVPVVVGFVRPLILLPASAATGLSADQLVAVIAHELAHIRRYDLIVNMLQRVIETLLFFHPAVWWISRKAASEREVACDEMVIAAGVARPQYADALLRMAEVACNLRDTKPVLPATALAADGAAPSELKRRILKVLGGPSSSELRPTRWAYVMAIAIVVTVITVPGVLNHFTTTANAQDSAPEDTDGTMEFLQGLRPDSKLADPAVKGRELAEADIATGERRILYYGRPWSEGKALIDDESGLKVVIATGCVVTRDFVKLVEAYNTAMRDGLSDSLQTPAAADAQEDDEVSAEDAGSGVLDFQTKGNSLRLEISPNGRRLVVMNGNPSRTMFRDGRSVAKDWSPTVDIIDTETEKVLHSLNLEDLPQDADRPAGQGPTFVEVTAIGFSPDSRTVAVGTSAGQVLLYDVETGEQQKALDDMRGRMAQEGTPAPWDELPRAIGHVKAIAFSADGTRLSVVGDSFADWTSSLSRLDRGGLSRTAKGRLKVFDVATGELVFNPAAHSDVVVDVAYSPDGRFLASAGRWMDSLEDGDFGDGVILWDAASGERLARLDLKIRGWMYDIEFSPDSDRILFGAQDFDRGGGNGQGVVGMMLTEPLELEWRRPIKRSAMSVAFNPQQSAVIALKNREALAFLAEESGDTELLLTVADDMSPQEERCEGFAISPQGHLLVMGVTKAGNGQVRYLRIGELDPSEPDDSEPGDDDSIDPQFSEPSEVVLSIGTIKFMLDFDSGETMDLPQVIRPEQRRMDIRPNQWQPYERPESIAGHNLVGIKVSDESWGASVSEVQEALEGERVQPLKELSLDLDKGATYFFATDSGTSGVLQLLGIERVEDAVNEPWGIRLRYKTFRSGEAMSAEETESGDENAPEYQSTKVSTGSEDPQFTVLEIEADDTSPHERTITLSVTDMPASEALAEVARQAGLTLEVDMVALAETDWDGSKLVSLDLKDAPFAESVADAGGFSVVIPSGACWVVQGDKLRLTSMKAYMQERADRQAALELPDWLLNSESGIRGYVHDDGSMQVSIQRNIGDPDTFHELASLPNVTKLSLDLAAEVPDEALQVLAKLNDLQRLELTHSPPPHFRPGRADLVLSIVKELPSLREVSLNETGATSEGIRHLSDNKNLKSFSVYQDGGVDDDSLEVISGWGQLESLSLTQYVFGEHIPRMDYSADSLRQLAALQSLTHLTLVGFDVPPEAIAVEELRSLHISGQSITDEAAKRIAQCVGLQALTLSGTQVGNEGLRLIAEATSLQRLTLDRNARISDEGISHLRRLPLRHIEIRDIRLTDQSFKYLSEVKTIRRIDISGSGRIGHRGGPVDARPAAGLTVEGMQVLKELPNLQTLWITGFASSENYRALAELQQLRELHFEMALTEVADLEFLERELPDTSIMAGTGGGWVGGFRAGRQ